MPIDIGMNTKQIYGCHLFDIVLKAYGCKLVINLKILSHQYNTV